MENFPLSPKEKIGMSLSYAFNRAEKNGEDMNSFTKVFIIQLKNEDKFPEYQGFKLEVQFGPIVCGKGTFDAMTKISEDENVSSIEGDVEHHGAA
jgi:hypothetical protein